MPAKARIALAIAVLLGGVLWANIRLVLVAVESQPACVPHATAGSGGTHRAARSSC